MISSNNKNPFFGNMMKKSKSILNKSEEDLLYQSIGANLLNNFIFRSREISYDNGKMTAAYEIGDGKERVLKIDNFNSQEFYFHDHTKIDKIFREDDFEESNKYSIGIHWYGGSPISQEANNILTEKNYKDFDTTISKAIRKVLS